MARKALITGVTGQDGSYLSEFLLKKGYEVHGIKRRASSINTDRIDHIYQDPQVENANYVLHYGDMTDSSSLVQVMQAVQPDEIYNLAAQSHVAVSFEEPEYTANSDALGVLRLLEAMRILDFGDKAKFYQASTSELYGKVQTFPQDENTPFHPRSPYAVAKLYGYWITVNYREAYGFFACNGILFNHESPRRGETFVTRKITRAMASIVMQQEQCLYLGNMDSKRDWGHAQDYVEMQWLMLQQDKPDDYVISTGHQVSVREFVVSCAGQYGLELTWSGEGMNEIAQVAGVTTPPNWLPDEVDPAKLIGKTIVRVDERYFRPAEVDNLCGDATKAKEKLGWIPKVTFAELVAEMTHSDFNACYDAITFAAHKRR